MTTKEMPLTARLSAVEQTLAELKKDFASGSITEVYYYKRLEALIARQHLLANDLEQALQEKRAGPVAETVALVRSGASEEQLGVAIENATAAARSEPDSGWGRAWLATVGEEIHENRGKLVELVLSGAIAVAKSVI